MLRGWLFNLNVYAAAVEAEEGGVLQRRNDGERSNSRNGRGEERVLDLKSQDDV